MARTPRKSLGRLLVIALAETAPIITDLITIQTVIECMQTTGGPSTQQHWGIIDRSSALTRITFEEGDSLTLSGEDDDSTD